MDKDMMEEEIDEFEDACALRTTVMEPDSWFSLIPFNLQIQEIKEDASPL